MHYEVKYENKIVNAETYTKADGIYKRYAKRDGCTRLYCVTDGRRDIMKVTSKKLREALLPEV